MKTNQLLNWLKNNLVGKDITKMSPEQAKMKLVAIQTLLEVTLQELEEPEEKVKEKASSCPLPSPSTSIGIPTRDYIKRGLRELEEEVRKRQMENSPYTLISKAPLDIQFGKV